MDETVPRLIRAHGNGAFRKRAKKDARWVASEAEYRERFERAKMTVDVPPPTAVPKSPAAGPVTILRANESSTLPAYEGRELARILGEREPLAAHERRAILRRDGYRCRYCGRRRGPFHVDHVLPVALGGTNDWLNLVTACRKCNLQKGVEIWTPRPLGAI